MSSVKIPWKGWELAREKPIGRGGFGEVYEIKRSMYGLEERAAMKILTIPKDESDLDALRFEGLDDDSIAQTYHGYVSNMVKEYETMQRLRNNPHVVHVYDIEVKKDVKELFWTVYIRMELLTPIMKKPSCIQSEKHILQLAKDICNALIACHKRNILHRDIKPENIFIDPDGNYKIGDFGISRVMEHTTRASVGVGTYDYMSPEVINGNSYGLQADIYSLGMVLYYLMNERRHPFFPFPPAVPTYEEKKEARNRKWSGAPIPPPKNGCDAFKRIIMKACAFSPSNRYFTVQNMLDELNLVGLDRKNIITPKEPSTVTVHSIDIPSKNIHDDGITITAGIQPMLTEDDTPTECGSGGKAGRLKEPPITHTKQPPNSPLQKHPEEGNGTIGKTNGFRSFFKSIHYTGLICIVFFFFFLIISATRMFHSKPDNDNSSNINVYESSYPIVNASVANNIAETEDKDVSSSGQKRIIDMDCDHIFEVFNGKLGIETACRYCGISMNELDAAGIELKNEPCECEPELIIQTNGTPAYECSKCHNITLCPNPYLTDMKLISDTNAEGKKDDVKYGSFYQNGREWDGLVRFWVANKSGYTNIESMEVNLANSYTTLTALVFAGNESDDNTNMTLHFYGDGELLYEMKNIVLDAEEQYAEIDVTDVEILKVECSTDVDAFGYCFLQGVVRY